MATPGIAASAYAQVARITDASAGLGGLNKAIGDAAGPGPELRRACSRTRSARCSSAGAKSDAQTQAHGDRQRPTSSTW